MTTIMLNGKIVSMKEAVISIFDRGFMFGDGAYEVIRIYKNKPFYLKEHMQRLAKSLESLRIQETNLETVEQQSINLIENIKPGEATLYIQVTRGIFPFREHSYGKNQLKEDSNPFEDSFPNTKIIPTVLLLLNSYQDTNGVLRNYGCKTILYPDIRWHRCDIKSINLLGNIFAAQAAKEANVYEAIFYNSHNVITEGSHTNIFAVIDGKLKTYPNSYEILPGITKDIIIRLTKELRIPFEDKPFSSLEIKTAQEAFLTGTTTEIMPIISIDKQIIGDGKPGKITLKLRDTYQKYIAKELGIDS